KRSVRYFILSAPTEYLGLGVFVFQLDLLDFLEWNHDFLRSMAALHLQVKVVGGNSADPLADVFPPRRFDHQHHVPLGVAADYPEEAGKLRFKEPPVESKLAALEADRGRQVGLRLLRFDVRQSQP